MAYNVANGHIYMCTHNGSLARLCACRCPVIISPTYVLGVYTYEIYLGGDVIILWSPSTCTYNYVLLILGTDGKHKYQDFYPYSYWWQSHWWTGIFRVILSSWIIWSFSSTWFNINTLAPTISIGFTKICRRPMSYFHSYLIIFLSNNNSTSYCLQKILSYLVGFLPDCYSS